MRLMWGASCYHASKSKVAPGAEPEFFQFVCASYAILHDTPDAASSRFFAMVAASLRERHSAVPGI